MKKITLSENCFGPDVEVDDESLFMHEYDNRNPNLIYKLQEKLINELILVQNNLSLSDWYKISEIIVENSLEFEYDTKNSKTYEKCDDCGNSNHKFIYIKK
jgi:hypothetical protein